LALSKKDKMNLFLQQNPEEMFEFETTINELKQIIA
jgi:flagellum-specific ATP synthase